MLNLRDFYFPGCIRFEDKRFTVHYFEAISFTFVAIDTKRADKHSKLPRIGRCYCLHY